ncbi:hypothetical protein GCM10027048_18000 [Hymenobacter coalescens]
MHAPFLTSAKFLTAHAPAYRLLASPWQLLKAGLAPRPAAEPGCSPRYAELHRQAQWATRLFWLASAAVGAGVMALAATETVLP